MATEIGTSTSTVSLPAVTLPAMPAAQPSQSQPVQQQSPAPQQNAGGAVKADSSKKLEQVVKDVAQMVRRDLNFTIDKDSGVTVVKVIDPVSKEVVRQIPPDEMLALAKRLTELSQERSVSGEDAKGLLMSTRV